MDRSDPHATQNKLAAGLAKIGLVMRHHAWKAGTESGVTPTQSQILDYVRGRAGGEAPTMSEIAGQLALTPATVSDSVAALERKGLIGRTRDDRDGRVVRVRLTRQGASVARQAEPWPDVLLEALGTLGPEEQAVFTRSLVKMIYALQQAGQIPVSRVCPTCTYFRANAHPGEGRPHHCAYVDAPLGDVDLRLDCGEHRGAEAADIPRLWQVFVNGAPASKTVRADGAESKTMDRQSVNEGVPR